MVSWNFGVCGLIMCEKKYHLRVQADTFNLPADISYASAADIDLTQPLAIGCRVVYGRSNDIYFNGAIDDVMIFDSELSSEEIKAMYNRGFSLGWDDNGNMTANDVINGIDTTLQYNWDNKLRSATKGTKSISIRYDPGGNRIWKESIDGAEQTTHKYIVDIVGGLPTTLMEMKDVNDTIIKTYVYANGQPLCRHDGDYSASRYFYVHDRLGSVRQIIDTSGNVKNHYIYEPFGELLDSETQETIGNPFKFTGQYFDSEIDQYYLRARQYDPHIYRFTSRDPVFGKFEETLSLHKYLYCENEPINRIDPFGKDYVDLNFSWCYGMGRGALFGSRSGPWGALGGAALGTFTATGGFMTDLGTGRNVYPYFGLGLTAALRGGLTTTLTHSFQDVEPGWYTAITVTTGISHMAFQVGWDDDFSNSVLEGEFNPRGVDFEEHGFTSSSEWSISVTRFYVFDKLFSFDNLLDQSVMLGQMFGSGNTGFVGLQYRNFAIATMLDNQIPSF